MIKKFINLVKENPWEALLIAYWLPVFAMATILAYIALFKFLTFLINL